METDTIFDARFYVNSINFLKDVEEGNDLSNGMSAFLYIKHNLKNSNTFSTGGSGAMAYVHPECEFKNNMNECFDTLQKIYGEGEPNLEMIKSIRKFYEDRLAILHANEKYKDAVSLATNGS